ncbi:MAG: response regulator [Alphaproteobacteria bacterium]|nr:response regulator [Alphaproteobacteria bacterium SS10]
MHDTGEYDLTGLRVLVVDDSEFMRDLMSQIFEELGCKHVIGVEDGQQAINEINLTVDDEQGGDDKLFDAVFSDWAMEPMDGLRLLQWVRSHPNPEIRFMPFIMVSAYSTLDWVITARDAGVSEFLTKPVSVKQLVSRLTSIIERPRAFVKSGDYFGPDRRRRSANFSGPDRRVRGT